MSDEHIAGELREDTAAIEVTFPSPVHISREHQGQLMDLVGKICDSYEDAHPDRVMWAAGYGGKITSMPITREDEEAGVPLSFDMSVLSIDCSERERYDTDRRHRRAPAPDLQSKLDEALSRIARLEEALEPFAKALDDWGDEPEQNDRRNLYEHPAAIGIGLGDLRRARSQWRAAREGSGSS